MDWITGEKFAALGNFTFAPVLRYRDDYDGLPNTFHPSDLYDDCIIYTHTFYVKQLFEELKKVAKQVYIVSHNSDMIVDESFVIPDNVIRWYAQNANVVNPKITHIPIGLENSRWFARLNKKQKMLDMMRKSYDVKNWLYVNHNVANNPEKREGINELFKDQYFATVESGKNGKDFDNYLLNLFTHKYMLCPEGNGIDTHRTWEALYMGTVPIEKRNINNTELAKIFPILLVDDWKQVTDELLYKRWWKLAGHRHMEELKFTYWQNKIKNGRE